jgi:hypothetical protein
VTPRRDVRPPPAPAAAIVAAAALAGLLAEGAPAPAATPELVIGPGLGVQTQAPSMLHPIREDVLIYPILTVGDTLAPADESQPRYVFYPLPAGIGASKRNKSIADVFVAHELPWYAPYGARLSRLALDLRNLGVLAADYLLDGSEGLSEVSPVSRVGPRSGFLSPTLLLGEAGLGGVWHGVEAAVDLRGLTLTPLPWLGQFRRGAGVVVPISGARVAVIQTENGVPGESQLYLYLADSDTDLLAGRGQLYVLHVDVPLGWPDRRIPSAVTKRRSATGRFVPIGALPSVDASRLPDLLENRAQSVGCTNFVRLRGAAPDPSRTNAFFFADTGDPGVYDPDTGRPVSGAGRIYYAVLDPFDPTRLSELYVVLDGDDGDDLFRPGDLADDDRCVMIQEAPETGRGLHRARVLRYDRQTRRLEILAECAEEDSKGRPLGPGIGGSWQSKGIVDASDIFGPDSWLLTVQAPNLQTAGFRDGGGQLLLLQGPEHPRPKPPKPAEEPSGEEEDAEPDSTR